MSFHDSRATFLETYRGHHGDGGSRVIINAQSSDDLGHTRLLMHFSEITRTLGTSAMSGLKTSFNELEALEKELDGRKIVNKLIDNFEILSQFRIIKAQLPPVFDSSCIYLKFLIKEIDGLPYLC